MTSKQPGVWLPAGFTAQHQKVVLKHLLEGRWTLSRAEWRWALEGFGLLHNAAARKRAVWFMRPQSGAVFVQFMI